jgi:hypothetical protein
MTIGVTLGPGLGVGQTVMVGRRVGGGTGVMDGFGVRVRPLNGRNSGAFGSSAPAQAVGMLLNQKKAPATITQMAIFNIHKIAAR